MTRALLLAYCLGIGLIVFLPSLEDWPALLGGFVVAFALAISQSQSRPLIPLLVLAFGLGSGWHIQWAAQGLSERLDKQLEGEDLWVQGRVISAPFEYDLVQQFGFYIESSEQGITGLARLNHYGDEEIQLGDKLDLIVRLNRPHSLANPGSFDREAQMLRAGMIASGYVREVLSQSQQFELSLSGIRGELHSRLMEIGSGSPYRGLVIALVLGEKSQLSVHHNELFAKTGTTHLFVISGLHIGLVAGVFFWLASLITSLYPPLFRALPRQKLAGAVALLAAISYAALAGFSLPTQRAVVMLGVVILSGLWGRDLATSYRLLVALALVLTLDPLATTSAGFWYSFVAVAGLLYLTNFTQTTTNQIATRETELRRGIAPLKQFAARLLKPQLTVFVLLLLPLLIFGGTPSVFSPLTNVVAIPVVGLLIVPLCLLASLLSLVGGDIPLIVFEVIDWLFRYLFVGLEWVAQMQVDLFGELKPIPRQGSRLPWVCASAAVALVLAPIRLHAKLLALPLMLPLLWPAARSNGFDLAVHVLDVGQGLAVIVQTGNHSLLYDTGFGVENGYSAGQAVIVPALKHLGISTLDTVVVSHGDNDHIGGLEAVLASYKQAEFISNPAVITQTTRPALSCRLVTPWQWEKVHFEFLNVADPAVSSNDQSCVLKVSVGELSVLLPGDIERPVELLLASQFASKLSSKWLIAPHHGSKSSSSYPFLKRVQPETVLISSGYNNRFGHPSKDIISRYDSLGIDYFVTHEEGMLSLFYPPLDPDHNSPVSYRKTMPRYWR